MTLNRRRFHTSLIAAAAGSLGAGVAVPAAASSRERDDRDMLTRKVFTSSNAAGGNELLVYMDDDGLAPVGRVPTGGKGSGDGLGSQGAVTLSTDGRWLFVVNAGDHSVSTFRLKRRGLELASVTPSGGTRPISASELDGLVYVLNAGSSNVSGFRQRRSELAPIDGSSQLLSSAGNVGPAQVAISTDGDLLVVTEKATNLLTYYALSHAGVAGAPATLNSPGNTPFGFAFDRRNRFFVSEAFGGASGESTLSSYRVDDDAPEVASAAVPSGQTAACWVVVSPNGRYAYVANTGSSNVSQYRIGRRGTVSLVDGSAGSTGAGTAPVDMAIPVHGRTLHVLTGGSSPSITSFELGRRGSLRAESPAVAVPAGAVGLAAN